MLTVLVANGSAYLSSSRETPQYSANATMLVNPGRGTSMNEYTALQASRSLADTYRVLVETGPVLDRVVDELNLEFDADELDRRVSTSVVGDTQLVKVTVQDTDPERAANIANTVVTEFSAYIDEQAGARVDKTRSELDAQISVLEERLVGVETSISELDVPDNEDNPDIQQQISNLIQERVSINQRLSDLNTTSITFNIENQAASAQVEMADPARVPTAPFSPQVMRSALLGAFVGLLIGAGVVALLEYLDNTVKLESNIPALTRAPALASVALIPRLRPGGSQVYTMNEPQSAAAEAIRLLRTNLDFAAATEPIKALTVTSAGAGEGKSTVAANLAVVMAQAGMSTVLIDADLRRPTQHKIFGVSNEKGLTTLLAGAGIPWEEVAIKVALPGLRLLPSGPIPPNPSDLLASRRFGALLGRLRQEVDLIIVDTSPVLAVSDPLAVAPQTDGIVMVTASHQTRVDALRHAAHSVHQGDIRLIGVVLNRSRRQNGATYYYGEYYRNE